MPKAVRQPYVPQLVPGQDYYRSPTGMLVSATKKLTPPRMLKMLRALGLTGRDHEVWGGWPLRKYIEANRGQTEKFWWCAVCENLELIRNPPEWTERQKRTG